MHIMCNGLSMSFISFELKFTNESVTLISQKKTWNCSDDQHSDGARHSNHDRHPDEGDNRPADREYA